MAGLASGRTEAGQSHLDQMATEQVPAVGAATAAELAAAARPNVGRAAAGPADRGHGRRGRHAGDDRGAGAPGTPSDGSGDWARPGQAGPSDRQTADPLNASPPLARTGQRDDPSRVTGQRADSVRLPAQYPSATGNSRPESPALGTPVSEARPPWESGPERPPWESGPQAPVPPANTVPSTSTAPSASTAPPASTDPAANTGAPVNTGPPVNTVRAAGPGSSTGAQPRYPWDNDPAATAGSPSAFRTGEQPVAWTGPQPSSRTGAQPVAPAGKQPTFHPAGSTGPQPSFHPAGSTGPQPSFHPVAPTAAPVARAGDRPASGTGAHPVPPEEVPSVERAPWESGDWDDASNWAAVPRDRDRDARAASPEPERDSGTGSGSWPTAARPARPERGAHRAAKHGKPSRWRGNRSSGDGES